MKACNGGVCAPAGFRAAGVHCGIRKNKSKKDLALIYSDTPCAAAAVYTQNLVKGAPITVTRENIADGRAQAVLCNSGNANTCNADGPAVARRMCELAASACGLDPRDVIVASTGVIGQRLDISPIEASIGALKDALSETGSRDAAEAIMTTDTVKKEYAVEFEIDGKICRLGGMAKGSGMIHPNMATTLNFITTDCAISEVMLQAALSDIVQITYNCLSIDGDTSTNDMVVLMSNGLAENSEIVEESVEYEIFKKSH